MGIYKRYSTEKSMEEAGAWVDFGDGIRVRVRSDQSMQVRNLRNKLMLKFRHALMRSGMPPAIEDQVNIELCTAVVVAWDGITDENEQPIPYSVENVRKVVTDLWELRRDILLASSMSETFRKQQVEDMVGNSDAPSQPASGTPGA
jgi:hypothetical protein